MVKTYDEIMSDIKARIGEDTSDDAIALVENLSDTLKSLADNGKEDWKTKYEQNDAEWRKRYKERFFNSDKPEGQEPEQDQDQNPDGEKKLTYDNLFKE